METNSDDDIEHIFDEISAGILDDNGISDMKPSVLESQTEAYAYSPLRDPTRDLRIVELHPLGENESDPGTIEITIRHVPIDEPPPPEDPRLTLTELRNTLPPFWDVFKTIEDRYIFVQEKENSSNVNTTWDHPAGSLFDTNKYACRLPAPLAASSPPYEALSYTWGAPDMTHHVIVRVPEQQGRRVLNVTESLWTALVHLRYKHQTRFLWIDAICLDQKNNAEKNLQIPRMQVIYRLASRVVVWLGRERATTKQAFAAMDLLAQKVEVGEDGYRVLPSPEVCKNLWAEELRLAAQGSILSTQDSEACNELLDVPWMSRLWIVQEVRLARQRPGPIMQEGSHTISLCKIYKAVSFLLKLQVSVLGNLNRASVGRAASVLRPSPREHRQALTRMISSQQCSNPLDRIYGLLGLTSPEFREQTKVSYEKKPADVNRDAFLLHTELTGRLELLPSGNISARELTDAPSWVPEFALEDSHFCKWFQAQFAANHTRAYVEHDTNQPRQLRVLGVHCAVVDNITVPFLGENSSAVEIVPGWQPDDLDTAQYTPTGVSKRSAYASTLLQNQLSERRPQFSHIFPKQKLWSDQSPHWESPLFTPRTRGPDEIANSIGMERPGGDKMAKKEALALCFGRLLFQTKEGYMGIAPKDTQKDDIIVVFLGHLNPVVLRPESGLFRYIGECFVQGLQDSTKLLGPLPDPWIGQCVETSTARCFLQFKNTTTGETTSEDPRLEPLDENWEKLDVKDEEVEQDDPIDLIRVRNRKTNEVIKHDPRMEPDRLRARNVNLEWFTLV